jgi:hypothetical protein
MPWMRSRAGPLPNVTNARDSHESIAMIRVGSTHLLVGWGSGSGSGISARPAIALVRPRAFAGVGTPASSYGFRAPETINVTPLVYGSYVASLSNPSPLGGPPGASPCPSSARSVAFIAELEEMRRSFHRLVHSASPAHFSGDEARAVVAGFADIERVAASGSALFTPVVVASGCYTKEGHGSAAQWFGALAGSSDGVAKGRLAAAERAAMNPALSEALHDGDLSNDQLKLVTKATTEVGEAADILLPLIQNGASHQQINDTVSRLRAAARRRETERARRTRIHAHRHFRWHQAEEGGIRGEFLCDEVDWARIAPTLEAAAKERWRAAGSKDGTSLEAHRLEAFIDLMTPAPGSEVSLGPRRKVRVETLVLIDAAALRRGTTEGDEVCEIEGIGAISVAAGTELLGEGGLRYLIKEGFDIKTVTKATRDIATCVDVALIARDRTCCVEGCGKRRGLERDHVQIDFANNGPTELDNLVRLCPQHHALKTYGGWKIEGEPGGWNWLAPAHPKSAGAISRARKVAAAKAAANITKYRNEPRRT